VIDSFLGNGWDRDGKDCEAQAQAKNFMETGFLLITAIIYRPSPPLCSVKEMQELDSEMAGMLIALITQWGVWNWNEETLAHLHSISWDLDEVLHLRLVLLCRLKEKVRGEMNGNGMWKREHKESLSFGK
jgi:hypothetical protein